MNDSEKVTAYIRKHEKWRPQLTKLREVFQQTELLEEVKWGSPTYTLNGKLVAGMAAFKNHFALWFHQGVFLKDTHKKLINAQEGVTKALRQWKFDENDSIDSDLILKYLHESIENTLAGKEVKPVGKKGVVLPKLLKDTFKNDMKLKLAFEKLTPGKQREYAEHIETAKREETKLSRLAKITPMIYEGKGLHDKYKNC